MTLQEKLRAAAITPANWDVPGLLRDAAAELDLQREAMQAIGCQSIGDDWTVEEAFGFMKSYARMHRKRLERDDDDRCDQVTGTGRRCILSAGHEDACEDGSPV